MSDHITLTLRSPLTEPIDADGLTADRFASTTEVEAGALPLRVGRDRVALGDLFEVRGARSTSVRIVGDVRYVTGLGASMSGGELIIDGAVGSGVGSGMSGGSIEVLGSADDDAGVGMSGGSLVIRGAAGDRVGAASPGAARGMTGGEIVVGGSVGADAGARMRRGLLYVGGSAGDRVARAIIAGTVIVVGRAGKEPASGSKRGTLVAIGAVQVPVTYRYACTYRPPHVRLALVHVRRRYGVSIGDDIIAGRFRRFTGDAGTIGRGEILEWIEGP